jgi:hypothetical protein
MTLDEFRKLSEADQANATWGGEFLSSRIEAGYKVLLYAVPLFYVEVYHSDKLNKILKLRAFNTTVLLDAFLKLS